MTTDEQVEHVKRLDQLYVAAQAAYDEVMTEHAPSDETYDERAAWLESLVTVPCFCCGEETTAFPEWESIICLDCCFLDIRTPAEYALTLVMSLSQWDEYRMRRAVVTQEAQEVR